MIWHDMAIYWYAMMGERRKSESRQSKSEGIKISHKERVITNVLYLYNHDEGRVTDVLQKISPKA